MTERVESLLTQILEEQRKTNQLLTLLIQALAEEPADGEAEPAVYLDGSPVHG